MNNMFVINQFTITGTNIDTYSAGNAPRERSHKHNVCLHMLLISGKINIFHSIQSQENVTSVTQHNILLRFKLHISFQAQGGPQLLKLKMRNFHTFVTTFRLPVPQSVEISTLFYNSLTEVFPRENKCKAIKTMRFFTQDGHSLFNITQTQQD